MSNSAFTPSTNLAIPATPTQAGTVTTVAQTFAGKKTFDGGAAIKGDTSGAAIASGFVGETVYATLAAPGIGYVGLAGSTVYSNLATFNNLSPGVWLLTAQFGIATGATPATNLSAANFGIATSSGGTPSTINTWNLSISGNVAANSSTWYGMRSVIVTPTTTTSYYMTQALTYTSANNTVHAQNLVWGMAIRIA